MTNRKQNKNINHHYITRSYQENFCDEDGLIWVSESNGKFYKTKPTKKFREKHFYTVFGSLFAENGFSGIEGDFKNILLKKIFPQKPTSNMERVALSMFMALMLNKTRIHRENMRSFLEEIVSLSTVEDKTGTNKSIIPTNEKGISIEEIKSGLKNFNSFHTIAAINSSKYSACYIYNMKWIIYFIPEIIRKSFICSDNPLHLCAPNREIKYGLNSLGSRAGLEHVDCELSFPISSKIALLAGYSDINVLDDLIYCDANYEIIEQINFRTMRGSEQIFANNKEQLEKYNKN